MESIEAVESIKITIDKICGADGLDCLVKSLTPSDRAYIEALSSLKRRREVASWRSLLRRTLLEMGYGADVFGADILYTDVGAPRLSNSNLHIGVSHSSYLVAVVVSAKRACAIDIEALERDFERVAHKYTTPDEISLFEGDERALAVIWSAKETLYKLSATSALDLIDDIEIQSVDSDTLVGRVQNAIHTLQYTTRDSHIVVYTI